jgi:hypothetical protein
MEHRWDSRKKITVNANLRYSQKCIDCVIRDVSRGGMFIEIKGNKLPLGAIIDISFRIHKKNRAIPYRLKGLVIHGQNNGIGVITNDVNDELAQQEILTYVA